MYFPDPDAPPDNLMVDSTSHSLQIRWDPPRILSGPTSYLVLVVPVSSSNQTPYIHSRKLNENDLRNSIANHLMLFTPTL